MISKKETSEHLINSLKIQSMETTNESQTKGKYFMITKKSDYKHAVKELKAMLKYVYPDREEDERQDYQSENTPIIHSNLSTYAQALIFFTKKILSQHNYQKNVSRYNSESKHQR